MQSLAKSKLIQIAIILLMMEALLRIVYAEKLAERSLPLIYSPDEVLGYRYIPGTEAKICIPSICKSFRINENGFYGPSFQQEKERGTYRIAVVGASNSTGIWLAGTENFSMKLAALFAEAGYPVEVINFSIDGRYRGLGNLRLIRDTVVEFEPDLVLLFTSIPLGDSTVRRENYRGYVIHYDGESPDPRRYCQEQIRRIETSNVLTSFYRWSYIARSLAQGAIDRTRGFPALRTFVTNHCVSPRIGIRRLSLRRSLVRLRKTRELLRLRGAELALASYWPSAELRSVAERLTIPFFELSVPITPENVHQKDGHYNEVGHRRIAEQLFKHLVASGRLPALAVGRSATRPP